ncbi:hypothetical protein BH20ACT4_BH20ACT4_06590 [soil metagenome]
MLTPSVGFGPDVTWWTVGRDDKPGPSEAPNVGGSVCALVLDRWVEQIPAPEQVSGVAFHYDAPSNQAPQTCLLAVTQEGEGWSLQLVLSTLLQTLDWVRMRAVSPEDLVVAGRSIPSTFVPGAITPWTVEELSWRPGNVSKACAVPRRFLGRRAP